MTDVTRVELAPGYSIASVINGCWQLSPDHGGGPRSERDTQRIFSDLVAHGFTTFDCADIYVGVEETIGRFRQTLTDPDSIQVHTKYAPDRTALAQLDDRQIDDAVDRSLRRLQVERLDLLQFHWWDYAVSGLDRVIERLLRAQQQGKIRLLGLTNFNTGHVRQMLDSGAAIATLQCQYSLLDRRPEKQMTRLCEERGIRLLPYGALAGGFLSPKWLDTAAPTSMNRSLQKYRLIIDEAGSWVSFQQLLTLLTEIAARHQTTASAIAARWVMDQDMVAAVILGTGNKSRASQNVALTSLQLSDEDRAAISALIATQNDLPGDMYDLERDQEGRHAGIIKTELHAGTGDR